MPANKHYVQVGCSLPSDEAHELQKAARAAGTNPAQLIKEAIRGYLARADVKKRTALNAPVVQPERLPPPSRPSSSTPTL